MLGRKKTPADPSKWVLFHSIDRKEYTAESFEIVKGWYRDKRVPHGSKIYDPQNQKWRKPDELLPQVIEDLPATTTVSIDGCRVTKYIDIESVEIVIGTGVFSEFTGEFADFFGARSTAFERKLQFAKKAALQKLKFLALMKGGNAVIGIDVDYTEFSNNRIGVIVNGTIVRIEAVDAVVSGDSSK